MVIGRTKNGTHDVQHMNQSEHMKRHVFHELEQSSAWAKGSFYVIHYLVGFYSYCRCEERLEASEQQHQPTPSDDLQRQQQQAAAADVATCLRKSSPATCKVLPAMSPVSYTHLTLPTIYSV